MIPIRSRNRKARCPVWPARPAAAKLRRATGGPILARPPVRAIQPSVLLYGGPGDLGRWEWTCMAEGKRVQKDREHWLVLTRSSLAGFNPIRDIFAI